MIEISPIRPGRMKRTDAMNSAMGNGRGTVNMPQGLSARAFTTISASTARMMIMIRKAPNSAMVPATWPISSRTSSPGRAAVAAAGDEQDHEVLHRAGEDYAGDQPEVPGR